MDNWGQGTFTLSVSRLYRHAIGKTRQKAPALHPGLHVFDKPFVQDPMQEYI
jgi:hypothetical protein